MSLRSALKRSAFRATIRPPGAKASSQQRAAGLRYRPIIELDQGGMGDVVLCVGRGPSGFNKLVVLKSLRKELVADEAMRQSFLAEARLSAQLNNANVVQVYEVIDTAFPCIVMEYLDGQPLSSILHKARDRFTLPQQLKVFSEVLAGLKYSHELKDYQGNPLRIVHRDVSPQNVFITYDGVVKVLDFGIAKTSMAMDQTRTGIIKGKIGYMPREQLLNESVDQRVDVYAVGCMLWCAAAGEKLWLNMTDGDIMRALIEGRVPLPSEKRQVDQRLEQVIMKALAPNPDERYASALELRAAIDHYLTETYPNTTIREVGELVCEVFSEEREERTREIQQALRAQTSKPPPLVPEGLESITQIHSENSLERSTIAGKRLWLWGAIAVTCAAIVGIAIVSRRNVQAAIAPRIDSTANQLSNGMHQRQRVCTVDGILPPPPCGHPTLVDDMEDGDGNICELAGRGGSWEAYSDGTGKQSPSSGPIRAMQDLPQCRGFSSRALHVQGMGFRSWGMGIDLNLAKRSPYDYKQLIGLRFWAKSNTDTLTHVRVQVATPDTLDASFGGTCIPTTKACNDHFGVYLIVSGAWVLYDVTFDSLTQEGWGVAATWKPRKAVQLHWVFKDSDFDVWIDDVELR